MVALDLPTPDEITLLTEEDVQDVQDVQDVVKKAADADLEEDEVEEVDRELTLEEQVEEIVLMLAEGKIGIHQFATLHGKAWTAVLQSRGQEDPVMLRQRAETQRRSSLGSSSPLTMLKSGFAKRSRASRRSKESFRETASSGMLLKVGSEPATPY